MDDSNRSLIGGAFTQEVVQVMRKTNERPIILALSNPTEQAYTWSNGKAVGKAVYAAGAVADG